VKKGKSQRETCARNNCAANCFDCTFEWML
jgi:hypothetical protein